ncbi:MAG: HK97 family phage prohead protease [Rikenellaceae bacterium]|nr:HK97 family phage prohead protease [Rikenellaceae bacterium]
MITLDSQDLLKNVSGTEALQELDEGRQYRNIDVSSFERRSEDDGEKTVTGYATTFNQPYELYRDAFDGMVYIVREQVDPEAFKDTDMADVIMQYDHEGSTVITSIFIPSRTVSSYSSSPSSQRIRSPFCPSSKSPPSRTSRRKQVFPLSRNPEIR